MRLDNTENKKIVDMCYKTHKTLINPIIDWTTDEVWEFIKEYEIPYCELYDKGYKRLGCIGCPMSSNQAHVLDCYPKYKALYKIAFQKMLDNAKEKGIEIRANWETGEDVYEWWIGKKQDQEETMITEAWIGEDE